MVWKEEDSSTVRGMNTGAREMVIMGLEKRSCRPDRRSTFCLDRRTMISKTMEIQSKRQGVL